MRFVEENSSNSSEMRGEAASPTGVNSCFDAERKSMSGSSRFNQNMQQDWNAGTYSAFELLALVHYEVCRLRGRRHPRRRGRLLYKMRWELHDRHFKNLA